MPLYDYRCPNCSLDESRIAGLDDHTVRCTVCGKDMIRLTHEDDLFRAYWESPEKSGEKIPGAN